MSSVGQTAGCRNSISDHASSRSRTPIAGTTLGILCNRHPAVVRILSNYRIQQLSAGGMIFGSPAVRIWTVHTWLAQPLPLDLILRCSRPAA